MSHSPVSGTRKAILQQGGRMKIEHFTLLNQEEANSFWRRNYLFSKAQELNFKPKKKWRENCILFFNFYALKRYLQKNERRYFIGVFENWSEWRKLISHRTQTQYTCSPDVRWSVEWFSVYLSLFFFCFTMLYSDPCYCSRKIVTWHMIRYSAERLNQDRMS